MRAQERATSGPSAPSAAALELRAAVERAREAINRRRAEGKSPAIVTAIPAPRDYAAAFRAMKRLVRAAQASADASVGAGRAQGPRTWGQIAAGAMPGSAPDTRKYQETGIERSQPTGDRE